MAREACQRTMLQAAGRWEPMGLAPQLELIMTQLEPEELQEYVPPNCGRAGTNTATAAEKREEGCAGAGGMRSMYFDGAHDIYSS